MFKVLDKKAINIEEGTHKTIDLGKNKLKGQLPWQTKGNKMMIK